jgi:hypothetical protein
VNRFANYLTVAALLVAAALRIFASQRIWHGISGSRCAIYLTLIVGGIRFLMILVGVIRKKLPWGRLVLPGLLIYLLVRIALGQSSRLQSQIIGVALELGMVAGVIVFVLSRWNRFKSTPHLEDVFESILVQLLPDNLARYSSRELVLLWEGLKFCFRGFRAAAPAEGFGYVEQSYIKMLPLLIVLGLLTEGLAYELLAHNHPLLRLVMHAVEVWAVLWCFGMYATMKVRPHQISAALVHLRCGVFSSCEFDPCLLIDVQPDDSYDLPPRGEVARMIVKGGPKLKIQLKEPVKVIRGLTGPGYFSQLLVSADDPAGFRKALLKASAARG